MIAAAKIRVGKALLFSPQTMLDYRLPNNPASSIKLRYSNAFDLLAHSPDTKVKVYLGTEDLADIYNVSPSLRYLGFDVNFIYGGPHNLMNYLFQRNSLLEIITSYIENRNPNIIFPELKLEDNPNVYSKIIDFIRGFYFNETDYKSLIKLLDSLQSSNPSWPAIYHFKGKLHAKFGSHERAVKQFDKAIALNNKDDAIFFDLGLSAIQTHEYERAESAFRKANELALPPSPKYLTKFGAALMLQKRYDDAIAMQHQALKINSNYAAAYYQLGLVMNITNRYSNAINYFERAIALGDKNPYVHKHLATAKDKVGQLA